MYILFFPSGSLSNVFCFVTGGANNNHRGMQKRESNARNFFFSSLSAMTENGSAETEFDQDYDLNEPQRLTRWAILTTYCNKST